MMIRKILLLIDGLLMVLSILLGLGYTYYIANVKYVNNTETVILSDMVNLKTIDTKEINITSLTPENIYEKNFSVENLSDKKTTYNILFNNISNEYESDLVYELYEGENLIVSQTIAPKTGTNSYIKLNIDLDSAQNRNYIIKFYIINRDNKDVNLYQNKKFNANLEINSLQINSDIKTATNYIIANNNIVEDNNIATGLFKTNDTTNNLDSYYYKGEVENNYVLFNNELWRIIRINEDGSIRIIKNDNLNLNYQFNSNSKLENSYEYLNSNVKNELDNYYNNTLIDFDYMLVEQNYCNTLNVVKNDTYKTSETNKSYYEYITTLKCSEENKLKIGLITYEEASLAGLSYGNNNSYNYLVKGNNKNTWMISKAGTNTYSKDNYVWRISENGSISEQLVTNNYTSVRPVINLKGTLNVIGVGTESDPYIFIN